MKLYQSGEAVSVDVPFVDDQGKRLVPTALSWRLLDDEGAELKAPAAIGTFDAAEGKVAISVAASYNTLAAEETHGFRRVELTITTASFTYKQQHDYLIEALEVFQVPANSFMTYETALLVARKVSPLNGWNAASEEARKFALFRAFDLLRSYRYEFRYSDDSTEEITLDELSAENFARIRARQLQDFRCAQLVQADYLLGGSPIEKRIADGLQSSTIGEISQFYRPRPTLTLAICKDALSYVGKYIQWGLKVGRG